MTTNSILEALTNMADVLEDAGYTRDTPPEDVHPADAMTAVGTYLLVLVERDNIGYAAEFVVETRMTKDVLRYLALAMIGAKDSGELRDAACTGARWYGENLIAHALAQLPSQAEIIHDRMMDAEIEARRQA